MFPLQHLTEFSGALTAPDEVFFKLKNTDFFFIFMKEYIVGTQ